MSSCSLFRTFEMEPQSKCGLRSLSFSLTLLIMICMLNVTAAGDLWQPLRRRTPSEEWTNGQRKGRLETDSAQHVSPNAYLFLKERDATSEAKESRLVMRGISLPPPSSPDPLTTVQPPTFSPAPLTSVQPTCANVTFNLTIADHYAFPDTFHIGAKYLSLIISPQMTCLQPEKRGKPCLELISPAGHEGLNVSMKFSVERNYRRKLDECRILLSKGICSSVCQKGTRMVPDIGHLARLRRDLGEHPVKCGLAYKQSSPTQYDIYAEEDHCPKAVTHECNIEITISNSDGIDQIFHTMFTLYDENELPECPISIIVTRPMTETFLNCTDRDNYLMNVCEAPGCEDYGRNLHNILNHPAGVTLWQEPYPKQGSKIMVHPNSEPLNMTIEVSQPVVDAPPVYFLVEYRPDKRLLQDTASNVRIVRYEGWSLRLICPLGSDAWKLHPEVTWHRPDGTVIGHGQLILLRYLRVEDTGMYVCMEDGQLSKTFDIHIYKRGRLESPMSFDTFTSPFEFSVGTESQLLTANDLDVVGIYLGEFLMRDIAAEFPNVESILVRRVNFTKLRPRNDSSEDFQYYHEGQCELKVTDRYDKVQKHREGIMRLINDRQSIIIPMDRTLSTVVPTPFNSGDVKDNTEGEDLTIHFSFYIVNVWEIPKYTLLWQFGNNFLNVSSSFQGEAPFSTNVSTATVFSPAMRLEVHTVNASLYIKSLKPTYAGEYRCHILLDLYSEPRVATVSTSVQVNYPRPIVTILPLTATVAYNSTVPYSCLFQNVAEFGIEVNGRLVKERKEKHNLVFELSSSVTTGPNRSEDIVVCYGKSPTDYTVRKVLVIRSLPQDDATLMCETSYDRRGSFWAAAPQSTLIEDACPENYIGNVTRVCSNNGTWLPSNYSACKRQDLVAIEGKIEFLKLFKTPSPKEVESITSDLAQSVENSTPPLHGNDINQVVDLLSRLGSVVSLGDREDGTETMALLSDSALVDVANVTDKLMTANQKDWKEATIYDMARGPGKSGQVKVTDVPAGRLILAMDKLVSSTLNYSKMSSQTIVKENLVIKRAKLPRAEDIRFPISDEKEYREHDGWVIQSQSSAFLSHDALSQNEGGASYSILLYKGIAEKLQAPKRKTYARSACDSSRHDLSQKQVMTDVLSFSLNDEVDVLSPSLELKFPISENANGPVCGFLDTSTGSWSAEGCQTLILEDGLVECLCDHLTNFAVLMSPAGTDITSTHHKVLSIVTIIGCSISIICLVITILAYALFWRFVKNDLSVLHVNLSACLIVSYIVFMTGINEICQQALCTFIAALLHYVLVVVFFLMLSEGVEIMLSVSVVFSRKSTSWKLLIASYGIPAILVAISLAATEVNGYRSEHYCWLSWESGTLWAFVGPALLVILANCVLAVIILRVMAGTTSIKNQDEAEKARKMTKALLALSSVLGIGWVFGILSVNSETIAFQYLFALLNSLQGLLIFIFHCLLSRQIRNGFSAFYRRITSRMDDYSKTKSGSGPPARLTEDKEMALLADDSEKK